MHQTPLRICDLHQTPPGICDFRPKIHQTPPWNLRFASDPPLEFVILKVFKLYFKIYLIIQTPKHIPLCIGVITFIIIIQSIFILVLIENYILKILLLLSNAKPLGNSNMG
jgi:hypothetical protein